MAKIDRTYTVKYRGKNLQGFNFGDTIKLEGFDPEAGAGHKRVDKIIFNGNIYHDPVTKNKETAEKWYFYCSDALLGAGPAQPKYNITLTPISSQTTSFNFLVGEIVLVDFAEDEDQVFGAESGGPIPGGWWRRLLFWR